MPSADQPGMGCWQSPMRSLPTRIVSECSWRWTRFSTILPHTKSPNLQVNKLIVHQTSDMTDKSTIRVIVWVILKLRLKSAGQKSMMMTPMDFYAAITPDCGLAHGVGAGVHVDLTEAAVLSGGVHQQRSPGTKSVLNEIGSLGRVPQF